MTELYIRRLMNISIVVSIVLLIITKLFKISNAYFITLYLKSIIYEKI